MIVKFGSTQLTGDREKGRRGERARRIFYFLSFIEENQFNGEISNGKLWQIENKKWKIVLRPSPRRSLAPSPRALALPGGCAIGCFERSASAPEADPTPGLSRSHSVVRLRTVRDCKAWLS